MAAEPSRTTPAGGTARLNRLAPWSSTLSGLLVVALLAVAAHREWLFLPDIILGHNWDFTFPGLDAMAGRMAEMSLHAYTPHFGTNPLMPVMLGPNMLFELLARAGGTSLAIKLLVLAVHLVAFLAMRAMLVGEGAQRQPAWFAAMVYAFSPFLLSIIIAGSWYAWVCYTVAPLYLHFFTLFLRGGRVRHLLALMLVSTLATCFLQYFALINGLVALYALIQVRREAGLGAVARRYVLAGTAITGACAFWVIPLAGSMGVFLRQTVGNVSLLGGYEAVRHSTQTILNALGLVGFLDRNIAYHAMTDWQRPLFWAGVLAGTALVTVGGLRLKAVQRLRFGAFFAAYLLVVFLAKGGNPPFGGLTMWLYDHIVLLRMFRSPQNMFFGVALLAPLLLGLALSGMERSRNAVRTALALACLAVFLGPWWSGDLGHERLLAQRKDHVDFYTMDPELRTVYDLLDEAPGQGAVLFVPNTLSPKYLANGFQDAAQGGVPEYQYLRREAVFLESSDTRFLERLTRSMDWTVIRDHDIAYVVLRTDIRHHFWTQPPDYLRDVADVLAKELDPVFAGKRFSLYRVPRERRPPGIWPTGQAMFVDGPSYVDLREFHPRRLLLDLGTMPWFPPRPATATDTSRIRMDTRRIDTTTFAVDLHGVKADDAFFLVHGTKYHPNWRLSLVGVEPDGPAASAPPDQWSAWRTLAAEPLPDAVQGRTASGLNAWLIRPGQALAQAAGSGDDGRTFTIHCVLAHRGQAYFLLGLCLSAGALATVGLTALTRRKKADGGPRP